MKPNTNNGTRMTLIKRISTHLKAQNKSSFGFLNIRVNSSNPYHPCSISLTAKQ